MLNLQLPVGLEAPKSPAASGQHREIKLENEGKKIISQAAGHLGLDFNSKYLEVLQLDDSSLKL